MASTSSSAIITSPSNYDVFLSFRGLDTRDSFTDHLYEALDRAGFHTFRDNDEINRGEELKPEIERAIRASKASIVVLSKNYATSTWCLDELWLILEQRRECNHFVLPVFYHVDPSDVRKQTNTFKIQVKPSTNWTNDNVNRWKAALMKVADLTGLVLSGPETKFLKSIVDNIYNKLACKIVNLPPNLIGMNARDKDINSWLKQFDIKILAICGMGGSGKTTLAQYIVSSNWRQFEIISFVEGINRIHEKQDSFHELYRKFVKDILGGGKKKVQQDRYKLDRALQTKKALIVLDDIVEPSQLQVFLGTGNINKESKIIITTRKNSTLKWFESRSWRCQEYSMELLDEDESLELLSLHAFGFKIPMEGYKELAKEVLQYCEGNPLALEVLGSSLSEDNSIVFWRSTLDLLKKDMNSGIQRVLMRSYNSLPYISNKELFLHIACFFVGEDTDYVAKILEHDYSASSGIKTLTNKCLLSVSPNNTLVMHRLLQEMGRSIIRQESKHLAERSRVWLSIDSCQILSKGEGSKTMEGLALDILKLDTQMSDIQMSWNDWHKIKSSDLKTDSLRKMDNLKLLKLNYVHLTGSYENFSEDLRWLWWRGFNLREIPSDLFKGSLVAIDMRDSNLKVFEPPIVLQSLKILNLQGSGSLSEIHNINRLPNLETLILSDCYQLDYVCESIEGLENLELLNMTGCANLPWNLGTNTVNKKLKASTSACRGSSQQTSFSLPHSLVRLFLKNCNLECTEYSPLSFRVQPKLQYLDLGGGLFEFLPSYNHLKNLRVLDLTMCYRLKYLLYLPNTLEELYIYLCHSLERITFESERFTLQEFGYKGCTKLSEIEGFIKLVPVAKLDETDLGHMMWLKEYQNCHVSLVGDDDLTLGRSRCIQMLYEFGIMSTSLPYVKDPNMMLEYMSKSPYVSFGVPPCPKNKRLKGLNLTFKYTILSGQDWAWFAKISTSNDVDYMYNPHVFGDPGVRKVGVWLSYWPIGNKLNIGDKVNVSIIVMRGMGVYGCGASLVYTDDDVADENLENNLQCVETLGGDLSGFQLSTGAYYFCRRDFFELMEVGRLTPGWLSILVGDTIDDTEVRGWRKTGRPKPSNPSFTESKKF
ncbi:disease resistance protein RRS1-like [Cynara cardunculus var. scolymus]|uniref:disease resistance protein RRS1-like n=1 Tax=Cynara cardunculus var. scolymus TaxID=59895 RepID=UPI000D62D4DC|nr:disease resistance protein RRS1-like [Cynara cardunculus var. scolymus]